MFLIIDFDISLFRSSSARAKNVEGVLVISKSFSNSCKVEKPTLGIFVNNVALDPFCRDCHFVFCVCSPDHFLKVLLCNFGCHFATSFLPLWASPKKARGHAVSNSDFDKMQKKNFRQRKIFSPFDRVLYRVPLRAYNGGHKASNGKKHTV